MRSESLSAFLGYMPSQRDRCPLQRRLLTGEKSNSGHETSRESEMRIDHFKTDNKMCHLNKALQHIYLMHWNLKLYAIHGYWRGNVATAATTLCDSRCGVEGCFFSFQFSPSLLFGWCPSFFPNLLPRDLESCAEDCKRRRCYHTDS